MKNKFAIDPPWVGHRLAMLESPAWCALSSAAKKVLDRLEIELMRNGWHKNGALVCTYQDFVDYGIRRPSIAGAVLENTAGGFLEKTRQGRRIAGVNYSNAYRLTYLPTANAAATDEWRKIKGNGSVVERDLHNFSQGTKTCLGKIRKRALRKARKRNSQTQNPDKRKIRKRASFINASHLRGRGRRTRVRGRAQP